MFPMNHRPVPPLTVPEFSLQHRARLVPRRGTPFASYRTNNIEPIFRSFLTRAAP
jgi:hypothetical protein